MKRRNWYEEKKTDPSSVVRSNLFPFLFPSIGRVHYYCGDTRVISSKFSFLFFSQTEPLDDTYACNKGEIIVGLKCVPADPNSKKRSKGTFLLLVKDAKNLLAVKSNGSSDPFCKRWGESVVVFFRFYHNVLSIYIYIFCIVKSRHSGDLSG